jgi:agmatinase
MTGVLLSTTKPSATFFNLPFVEEVGLEGLQVGILGVPYDGGGLQPVTKSGQSEGPGAVRGTRLLVRFNLAEVGFFDIDERRTLLKGVRMADCGDVNVTGNASDLNMDRMTEAASQVVQAGAILASVGGDHSISYPLVKAFGSHAPLDVVQIDAHFDFVDELDGSRFTHGSNMRRISELPFVRSISTLGAKTVFESEFQAAMQYGVKYASPRDVRERGMTDLIEEYVEPGSNVYVTVDLDAMSNYEVLGTTKPEPGGIRYEDYIEAFEAVSARANVVGFDIVELCPPHDPSGVTTDTAAWLLLRFLAAIYRNETDLPDLEGSQRSH